MIPHSITQTDYFSPENNLKYMGVSQFKSFENVRRQPLRSCTVNMLPKRLPHFL